MTPLALSGSDHESSMVVLVIPREVRFSGFVGAVRKTTRVSLYTERQRRHYPRYFIIV